MQRQTRWTAAAAWASLTLLACGDAATPAQDTPPPSERPEDPCASRGAGPGVWGRVVAPSCASFVSRPTVTLLDALQFDVAEVQGDDFGEFRFAAADLPGDGAYVLRVSKGPYSGPDAPMTFQVTGGQSDYQVVKLSTGAEP